VTIKFMIPNSRMGSVIGKQGTKIKEIQDASGARLNASEGMLPGSTEVSIIYISYQVLDIFHPNSGC
jgi:ribosomal protein S3